MLKEIGLNDQKSQEFIEIIEESNHSKIEQETKRLVTNETFLSEISKIRKEISLIREELTKETTSKIIGPNRYFSYCFIDIR